MKMPIPMIPIPDAEKTILISKQEFADRCSMVTAVYAQFLEKEEGEDPMKNIKKFSRLLAGITAELFDDDEPEGEVQ